MAKLTVKGLDELLSFTNELSKSTDEILKIGMYDGVAIIADEVNRSIDGLKTQNGTSKEAKYINDAQKQGLKDGFGVARYRSDNGVWSTVIGFNGYNRMKSRKYPDGQPNQMIARCVESGTSYTLKQPFMRQALTRVRKKAVETMQKKVISEINKLERK